MRFIFKIVIFLAILSGCAGFEESMRYQPMNSLKGGYADYKLSKNVWQIYYIANNNWGFISGKSYLERMANYLTRRAITITKKNGYDYFTILNVSISDKRALDILVKEHVVKHQGVPIWVHYMTIRMGRGRIPARLRKKSVSANR